MKQHITTAAHDIYDPEHERIYGPDARLFRIHNQNGQETLVCLDYERDQYEADTHRDISEGDTIPNTDFAAIIGWLQNEGLMPEPRGALEELAFGQDHWSTPDGCHPDCPACAHQRSPEEQSAHELGQAAKLHALDVLRTISTLVDHLEETHQQEIANNHYGDEPDTCSYCRDIAAAKTLLDKLQPKATP